MHSSRTAFATSISPPFAFAAIRAARITVAPNRSPSSLRLARRRTVGSGQFELTRYQRFRVLDTLVIRRILTGTGFGGVRWGCRALLRPRGRCLLRRTAVRRQPCRRTGIGARLDRAQFSGLHGEAGNAAGFLVLRDPLEGSNRRRPIRAGSRCRRRDDPSTLPACRRRFDFESGRVWIGR